MTDLAELIKAAQARYDALSPQDKARHNYEQRRSYIRGEMMFEHPEMTIEEVNKLIDECEIRMGIVKP